MPISRYEIRNEYSLADPDLYREADKDDPEALLEGVAMAGLVGVLRQLGDLAEFAAEIFHDLHEEVMVTAARGHGLMVRVQQIEADFPAIEKAFLSQTNHAPFFSNAGTDWHPNLQTNQNLITHGDLPRFIMDSYEECRGPPRLFLLDKFDVAGAGACLKRYTDPSFFKVEASSFSGGEVQMEKKTRKAKKKGSRLRNGETPEVLPTSHAKLHQLFLEERVASGVSDPARLVKLKRRLNGFPFHSKSGKSYMEKFLQTPSPEDKRVNEISVDPPLSKLPSNVANEPGFKVDDNEGYIPSILHYTVDEKDIAVDRESKTDGSEDGYESDEVGSEIDNYVDALAIIESETEADLEFRMNLEKQGGYSDANKEPQLQSQYSDSQSVGNSSGSDDGNSSAKKSTSRFSYSETGNLVENMPSDGDEKARNSPSEHADVSFDQASVSQEVPMAQSAEASSTSCHTNSEIVILPVVDREEISTDGILGGPELEEVSSDPIELDLGFIDDEENETNREEIGSEGSLGGPEPEEISSSPNKPDTEENGTNLDDNLETIEDLCPTESAQNLPLENLDDEDPNVFYSPYVLSSHTSEDVLEKKSNESMSDTLIRTDDLEDICTENLVNTQIVSPDSVISHAEEQPPAPTLLEYENCNSDTEPEGIVSVADDILSVGKIGVDFTPTVDSLEKSNFAEQQVSKITDDCSPLDHDSILYSEDKVLELPSDLSNTLEAASLTEFHVHLDERETETILPDNDGVVDADVADNYVDKDDANFQLENFRILQEESIPSLEESDQNVLEINNESGSESESQHNVTASSTTGEGENSFHLDNSTAIPSYSNEQQQESELESESESESGSPQQNNVIKEAQSESDYETPEQGNLIEEAENGLSSPTFCLSDLTSPFAQKDEVRDDQHDMETPKFSQSDNIQSCFEPSSHLEFPSIADNDRHVNASLESCSPPLPVIPFFDLLPEATQIDLEEMPPLPPLPPMQWRMGKLQHTSGQQNPGHFPPIFPSIPDERTQIGFPPFGSHFMQNLSNPFPPSLPNPGVFSLQTPSISNHGSSHDAFHNNTFITSEATSYEVSMQPSFNTFSPEIAFEDEVSTYISDTRSLHQLPAVPSFENEKFDQSSVKSGSTVESSPSTSAPCLEDEKVDKKTVIFGVNVETSPIASVPSLENGKVDQGSVISDVRVENFPNTSVPSLENEMVDQGSVISGVRVENSPNTSVPSLENEKVDQGSVISSVRVENSPHTSVPSLEIEKVDQGSVISGVRVESPPTTSAPSLENENIDQGSGISWVRVENPNNTSATSLENENLEQHSIISEVKGENSSNTIVSPEIIEDELPPIRKTTYREISWSSSRYSPSPNTSVSPETIENELPPVHNTSEGEISWPLSRYLPPNVDDDGRTNLIRPLRIPRPRSPLIDAVAAHDKSKLRKVTERSRPPTPKADERDSLLAQIRNKSFNLKPAIPTRPSIGGPTTNLKVAAILEKANSIRQALAGSDEDDDTDWSD